MIGVRCRSPSSRGAVDRGPVGDDQRLLRVGNRSRRVVRRCTVECEQTSAARDDRQRSKSQKMKLDKRVKRTFPEGNGTHAIILKAVR
jgi:hypothetical protein